jgi:hypothetical protein
MITCPKCTTTASPGASDCTKCGYVFSVAESTPGFSPKNLFKWWLGFYAFWRAFAVFNYGVAAYRFEDGVLFYYFSSVALLAAISILGILVLWRGKRAGLVVFIVAEVLSAVVQLIFGNIPAAIYPLGASVIMWLVHKRATASDA